MKRSNGFVLLSVIFSVTLLLTAAVAFAWFVRNQLQYASTEDFLFRSRCAARIACDYAANMIGQDQNGYDSFTEVLYSPAGGIDMELSGLKVTVKIKPLNDKIAIQGLFLPGGMTVRTEYEQAWKNIWNAVGRPDLELLSLDFMDTDGEQRMGSVEKPEFLNRAVVDLCEFKLLDGVSNDIIFGVKNKKKKGLEQFISVAGSDKINVNTVNAETLAVLDSDIGYAAAQSFIAARNVTPVKNISDIKVYPGFSAAVLTRLSNVLSAESTHFELSITVSEGGRNRKFKAVIRRGEGDSLVRWEE